MREILFRGQTRRFGEKVGVDGKPLESNWVYGGVFQGPNKSVIYGYDPVEKHVVYSDTVGQYTGLTDRNGKKIFDGDIVKHFNNDSDPEKFDTGVILWNQHACQWERTSSGQSEHYKIGAHCKYEVIDNIHDNPELLKERNNA